MKSILLITGILICSISYSQTLHEELAKLDFPNDWRYQLKYDQDTSYSHHSKFKEYFNGTLTLYYKDTIKGWFSVCECNEKTDFCKQSIEFRNDSLIYESPFSSILINYWMMSSCFYDPEHPPISSFSWKNFFFLAPLCSCEPDRDKDCKRYELILIELFGYIPPTPYKTNLPGQMKIR